MRTIGMTGILPLNSFNPSIDEVTVIAGVITPSASNALSSHHCKNCRPGCLFTDKCKEGKNSPFTLVVGPAGLS